MCFVVFIVVGAFAVSLLFLFFSVRKIIKNGPCLFGKRRDC
ncbi:hypothetical protein WCX72_01235 [Sulfurimonas sp. HSL1-6]